MSFSIYVQFFENGEDRLISSERVASMFGESFNCSGGEPRLRYAEDEYPDISGNFHEEYLDSFSVSSPPVTDDFWNSVLKVLTIEGSVLMVPGIEGVITANENSEKHFPASMIESLPGRFPVLTGNDIVELVKNA